MPEDPEARIGTRLGNYVLQQVIGRGGMGVVYRGEHVYIHKPAAVKVLHRRYFDHPEALHRFLQEAQAASVIDHPNIVGINDFGEAPDGTVFLVMAYVVGVGLDEVLREQVSLPLFRALGIMNQLTRALGVAHAKGIVHRDLKPENIMLAAQPGRREIVRQLPQPGGGMAEVVEMENVYDFVTILDFGAAKFWHQSASPLGENGTVIGTPAYMAPETARTGVADARSDIYSVGVIFYEMLTGTVPFDGENAMEIMIKHVSEPVQAPTLRNRAVEITPEAEKVILRCLEKDPARRYANMEETNAELQRCFGAVRFRRAAMMVPPGSSVEALRRTIPLTPDKMKRRTTPQEPVPVTPPVPERRRDPSESGPVLLTRPKPKRRTGRHQTLPFISVTEPEPEAQTPPAPRRRLPDDE